MKFTDMIHRNSGIASEGGLPTTEIVRRFMDAQDAAAKTVGVHDTSAANLKAVATLQAFVNNVVPIPDSSAVYRSMQTATYHMVDAHEKVSPPLEPEIDITVLRQIVEMQTALKDYLISAHTSITSGTRGK